MPHLRRGIRKLLPVEAIRSYIVYQSEHPLNLRDRLAVQLSFATKVGFRLVCVRGVKPELRGCTTSMSVPTAR
jgi:hypothetical protein